MAVTQLTELIGKIAMHKYNYRQAKTMTVYQNWGWTKFPDSECKIDTSKPETKKEMDIFNNSDPLSVFGGKLDTLQKYMTDYFSNETNVRIGRSDGLKESLAPQIQGYLNDYNHEFLFKMDMRDTLSMVLHKMSIIKSDKVIYCQNKEILNSPELWELRLKDLKCEQKTQSTGNFHFHSLGLQSLG